MLVEVVGAVQGGIVLLGDGAAGGVNQGRVDLQQVARLKPGFRQPPGGLPVPGHLSILCGRPHGTGL